MSTLEKSRYLLKTLGCKANLYDSQLMEAELQKRGWLPSENGSEIGVDLCIVNSCTVTDEADRQSRKMASRLSRDNPAARVVVTGCSAEVDPETLSNTQGVHYVVGNRDKHQLVELVLKTLERDKLERAESSDASSTHSSKAKGRVLGVAENYDQMLSRHPMDREWATPESSFMVPPPKHQGEAGRTRTFLKIQEGCNSFCTYCIIPYGRGPSRSLKIPEVVAQIQELVSQGVSEVVITGINIGDYGTDWPENTAGTMQLAPLFHTILRETKLERLRVSSLDPTEITEELLQLMESNPRFCPHFHVSLQSPHARILKLMKRKYSWEHVQACLKRIAEIPAPAGGPFVGMDVITGFPGETQEDFEWTKEALSSLPWSRLHVFPYSERTGTPATRLPNSVHQHERVARAHALRELSFERLRRIHHETLQSHQSTGRLMTQVLVENPTKGPDGTKNWIAGYTPHYLRVLVRLESEAQVRALHNQLLSVRPTGLIADAAAGDLAFIAELA
ncbi:MAG: tRNA (N(6)-L-threonylcarbamoyladenosine(37)-C(2))-methylthiotransferase MtaB [Methylotenera sp.]|nr:tRNA (N(6)-L-threonylcarbamoyladenosine(37)-C(2))-methylthiotransferase MtaB [Oligoflexia bacterium]